MSRAWDAQWVSVDFRPFERFFQADQNVICALAFGSAKDGLVRPGGDLDIAVLFHQPPAAEADLAYYSRLCDLAPGVERLDYVVLNRANEVLAFEALKGRHLCKNDPEAAAAFYSLACRLYEDAMAGLARQRAMRRQLQTSSHAAPAPARP